MTTAKTQKHKTTKLNPNAGVLYAPLTRSEKLQVEADRALREISTDILSIQIQLDLDWDFVAFKKSSLAMTRALSSSLMKYATVMNRLQALDPK